MDEVWYMVVSPDMARQRIMDRNGLSGTSMDRTPPWHARHHTHMLTLPNKPLATHTAEAAEQRIRSQMPNAERAARASVVIDSSGPKEATAAELKKAAAALRGRVKEEYGFDLVSEKQ